MSPNKDGSQTLWFSDRGKLYKVVRYSADTVREIERIGEDIRIIQTRDAKIFDRGRLLGSRR